LPPSSTVWSTPSWAANEPSRSKDGSPNSSLTDRLMRCFNFCVGEIDMRADISHHPGRRSSRRGAWLISDEVIQDVDLTQQAGPGESATTAVLRRRSRTGPGEG